MREPSRKVTVNVPIALLERATEMTGQSITDTIVAGLLELQLKSKRSALRQLKGKVHFELNLDETRR